MLKVQYRDPDARPAAWTDYAEWFQKKKDALDFIRTERRHNKERVYRVVMMIVMGTE